MIDLLLFPFNGNAMEALDCVDPKLFNVLGFMDDDKAKIRKSYQGLQVFGREILKQIESSALIFGVPGRDNTFRQKEAVIQSLGLSLDRFATLIHPKASISPNARIGKNTVIMAGTVLTSNAIVGNHCCILPNSVIHHDSVVGDYSTICSGVVVAGRVRIGKNTYIGAASVIKHELSIGEGACVGAGANVVKDVDPGTTVIGNPARIYVPSTSEKSL